MKKIGIKICLFIFAFSLFPVQYSAKTLRQAYQELDDLETSAAQTKKEQQLTEQQMIDTRNEISSIYNEMKETEAEKRSLEQEIKELNEDINQKNEEIKELSKYLQVSTGESAYLEYAFGSESLTEFVYRMAVIDELNKYNSQLIEELKNNIAQNEIKTKELEAKTQELEAKQRSYSSKLISLDATKAELEDSFSDITDDIADTKALLRLYEASG